MALLGPQGAAGRSRPKRSRRPGIGRARGHGTLFNQEDRHLRRVALRKRAMRPADAQPAVDGFWVVLGHDRRLEAIVRGWFSAGAGCGGLDSLACRAGPALRQPVQPLDGLSDEAALDYSSTPQNIVLILRTRSRRRCRSRCHNWSRSRWGTAGTARLAAAGTTTRRAAARRGAAGRGAATRAARRTRAETLAASSPSRVSTDQQHEQQNGQ